jgi:hypothetical protein
MNCGSVMVNKYQNAETLGKKKFKAGVDLEMGREMNAGISINKGEITTSSQDLNWQEFTTPIYCMGIQYGLTQSTDINIGFTTFIRPNSSGTFHIKQNILNTLNNFSIAVMPGVGLYRTEESDSDHPNRTYNGEYVYKGFVVDVPLIISKRWDSFSIFASAKYIYNTLNIETEYEEFYENSQVVSYRHFEDKTHYFNSFGVSTGFSIDLFTHLHISPEISFLNVRNLSKDSHEFIYYPGLGLSWKF